MSILSELNIVNTCRICLFQSNELNSLNGILESEQITLKEILISFAQVQIDDDNGLPTAVCNQCTNQIIDIYNFKLKCEKNEKILLDYITRTKSERFSISPSSLICEESKSINIKVESDNQVTITQKEDPLQNKTILCEFDNKFELLNPVNVQNTKRENYLINSSDIIYNHPFRCEICSYSCTTQSWLAEHKKTHNLNDAKYIETCNNDLSTQKQYENIHIETPNISLKENQSNKNIIKDAINIKREKYECIYMPNGQKNIQCKICSLKLNKIYELREHLLVHANVQSFENIQFSKNNSLIKNIFDGQKNRNEIIHFIITEIKQNKFSKFYSISNKFGTELSLSDSETETDPEEFDRVKRKTYICEICNKTFDRKYKILYHQDKSHNANEFPYKCNKCTMKFSCEQIFVGHLKSQCENVEKQFLCECGIKFKWKENLNLHRNAIHSQTLKKIKKKHDAPKEKSFLCKICDKSFFRQEHLDRHMNIHQPDEKKFECPTCHKKFSRKDNMKSHMRIHCVERDDADKHLCVYCGRKFSNSSNLIVHVRRHTGEKPYKCDICGKGFPRSSDLHCHRRTHTGEKPCLCTICGKGFSRSNKLVRHMRIHTGVRPYKCTYCDRAFTQSNDLTLHIRRHTGDKPYVCGICGDRFIQGTALQTHRRLKGHFEEGNEEAPYSNISVNNPNRLNFANRVDRIGIPRISPPQPIEIKPVGRGNSRLSLMQDTSIESTIKESLISPRKIYHQNSHILTNSHETTKVFTDILPSCLPVASSSAYLMNTGIPIEGGDLFAIPNLNYQQAFN